MKKSAKFESQRGFMPILAIVLVAVIAGGSVTTVAAQQSLPGDALYPVKEVTDNIRVATQLSEEGKTNVHLAIANEKAVEIEKLEAKGASPEHIAIAAKHLEQNHTKVENHTSSTHTHSKDHLPHDAQTQLQHHQEVLTNVLHKVPDHAKEAIQHTIDASTHKTPTPSGEHKNIEATPTHQPTPEVREHKQENVHSAQ